MSKLSLDFLKNRANHVATEDLLNSINGDAKNDYHTKDDNRIVRLKITEVIRSRE